MSDQISPAQNQLDLIFNTAPMGLMLLNQELEMISCNPALLHCLDYEEGQLIHTCLTDLCHPQDREIMEDVFNGFSSQSGEPSPVMIRFRAGTGSYQWVELAVGKSPPGQGFRGSYVVVVQDIQDRKEMEMEVLELRHRLNIKVEQERNQLAQDLHDGPLQDLHSIQYQLSAIENQVPPAIEGQIEAVVESVNQVKKDLRRISYNLRPPVLSRFGLAKTIRSHAEDFAKSHPEFTLKLDLADDGDRLDEDIRMALFRIYQQAVGNILEHSEASEFQVSLNLMGGDVELRIEDDGKGFNLPERWISLVREGHYGLAGSHDRVTSLGGDFQVDSAPGQGTTLLVRVPDVLEEEG